MGVDSISAIVYHVIETGINLRERITTMAWERKGCAEKETAFQMAVRQVNKEDGRHRYLLESRCPALDDILNLEVREIFTAQIMHMFKEDARKDGETLDALCCALEDGNAGETQRQMWKYLRRTISIRDTFAKRELNMEWLSTKTSVV